MKTFLITIITFCSFINFSIAQFGCDLIYLQSQEDIDSFPRKYGYCNKIFTIQISDNQGPIFNLDSLSGLTELGVLDVRPIDSLNSISGLYNLRKVDSLLFYQLRDFPPFPKLDTIGNLQHVFRFYQSDLSLYQNIKHISRGLGISGNCELSGLSEFTCSKPFRIGVSNNKMPNDISNLIPKNSFDFIQITFISNENLSLHGLDSISSIRNLYFNNNKNCDFTALHNLKNIHLFFITSQDMFDVQFGILSKIKSIDFLRFSQVENLKNMDQLFPNLENIKDQVYLNDNPQLKDIGVLDRFEIPVSSPLIFPTPYKDRINITNNPNLTNCANDYICRALQVYPDSVTLSGNGFNCEKEDLLSSCINSTSSEENDLDILLYPNPAIDKIYWDATHDVETFDLFDIQGRLLISLEEKSHFVDISEVLPGMYVCKMKVAGKVVVRKMVKE